MSTMIKYTNILDEFVTEQQVAQLTSFHKQYIENGELKKIERYSDNELFGGVYYLSDTENPVDVLNILGVNLLWVLVSNKQIINGYTVWEYRSYDVTLQVKKFYKVVLDLNDRQIATITYDVSSGIAKGAFKIFYFGGQAVPNEDDTFFDEDDKVTFSFDDNGNLERINISNEYVNNDSTWYNKTSFLNQASGFINDIMTSNQLNYFTNVEPLVPNF